MVAEDYTLVKMCRACLIEKTWAEFYTWSSSGKPRGRCKDCTNAAKRKGPPRGASVTENGKICTRCKVEKPFSDYGFNNKQRNELKSRCKDCSREAHAEWNEKNRESVNSQVGAWKRRNPVSVRAMAQNRRALKRDAGGSFSSADIKRLHELQRGMCAACFKPLKGDYHIDHRVALSRGGSNEWTNLQLLHAGCNLRKKARDPIDFMQERGFLL